MTDLITFIQNYTDLGCFFLLLAVLYLRYKKVWVDGPTHTALEDRCVASEGKLETYRARLEDQAKENVEQTKLMAHMYLEDRRRE
jgi:hypothetical protein